MRELLPRRHACTHHPSQELKDCCKDPETSGLNVKLVDESNMLHWKGQIKGPVGTPYEGGVFAIDIVLPTDYPFVPPKMKYDTRIWHPNISSESGAICLDILKNEWSPALTVRTALISLQALMSAPEPDDPQDAVVAKQCVPLSPSRARGALLLSIHKPAARQVQERARGVHDAGQVLDRDLRDGVLGGGRQGRPADGHGLPEGAGGRDAEKRQLRREPSARVAAWGRLKMAVGRELGTLGAHEFLARTRDVRHATWTRRPGHRTWLTGDTRAQPRAAAAGAARAPRDMRDRSTVPRGVVHGHASWRVRLRVPRHVSPDLSCDTRFERPTERTRGRSVSYNHTHEEICGRAGGVCGPCHVAATTTGSNMYGRPNASHISLTHHQCSTAASPRPLSARAYPGRQRPCAPASRGAA